VPVGFYRADLIANARVIVEAKTGLVPDPIGPVQLLNYLRAADLLWVSSSISGRQVRE
jgi:hypothetical protein